MKQVMEQVMEEVMDLMLITRMLFAWMLGMD